jgi:hypothetical protein
MPEEESFAVLVRIMTDYRMREMFKPSMAELGLCMYQLDTLVQEHIPELYVHFQSQAIHTNLYASSWFLTLFTTSLFLPIACRILDCFLSEGIEVDRTFILLNPNLALQVIFRISLALLLRARHSLLHQDMEGVLTYFQVTALYIQMDTIANFQANHLGACKCTVYILLQSCTLH